MINSKAKLQTIIQIVERGEIPKASDFKLWAELQGWQPTQTPKGPLKYVDENGVARLTLKQGSSRTPGSNYPHVELRMADRQRIDIWGNHVTRTSPGNHIRIQWDI
jgi:filamentous hemagglutinin